MMTISSISEVQQETDRLRMSGKRIALVPTMGSLHKGHTSLIVRARNEADVVVTSLFVNPAQFGPSEDFARYPRDLEHDTMLAAQAGTDILFVPSVEEMYPKGYRTYIEVEGSSLRFEGAIRPGHFRGVATVVAKLFEAVRPHVAVFGQKDAQQAWLIRQMTADLNLGIEIIVSPTVREADGVAMSSRNTYLTAIERKNARVLNQALLQAQSQIMVGVRNVAVLESSLREILLGGNPSSIDYATFVDPDVFEPVEVIQPPAVLVIVAVRFGTTRLLDNMFITVNEK
jgi:pantoate--beta-alanine ligase